MKIALRCTVDEAGSLGGAALHSVLLADALSCIADRVDVYTASPELFPRCRAIEVKPMYSPSSFARVTWWLRNTLYSRSSVANDVDCVIYGNQFEPLLRQPATKQVMIVHDVAPLLFPRLYPRSYLYFRLFLRRVLSRLDRVVVRTTSVRDDLLATYRLPASHVEVIAGGLNTSPNSKSDATGAEDGHPEFGDYVLYVGKQFPNKNIAGLIQALRIVRSRRNVSLVVAGEIDERYSRGYWQLAERCGIADGFYMVGPRRGFALASILRGARLLVHPSLYEGFGMTPLEAMAAGVPVAVARRGSLPEVCGSAAIYFDPLDITDMAAAIDRLLSDEGLRQRCIVAGRAQAKRFDWHAAAQQYLGLVARLHARAAQSVPRCTA